MLKRKFDNDFFIYLVDEFPISEMEWPKPLVKQYIPEGFEYRQAIY